MPLLKHAKKKLRQDKKRTLANKKVKDSYKKLVKTAKEVPTMESLSEAYSAVDKAVKKQIIHANKAARIKSGLSKLSSATGDTTKKATVKKAAPTKKAKATKVKETKAAAKKASTKTTKKK